MVASLEGDGHGEFDGDRSVRLDPPNAYSPPSSCRQLWFVIKKNVLLRSRAKGFYLEILLPLLISMALLPAWLAIGEDSSGDTLFSPSFVDVEARFNTLLKCRRNNATDPRIAGFADCGDDPLISDRSCLGDLCLRLPTNYAAAYFALGVENDATSLLSFDTVALIRHFGRFVNFDDAGQLGEAWSNGWYVAVASDDEALAGDFRRFLREETYTYQYIALEWYDTEQQVVDYTTSRNGSSTVWGLVVLRSETEYSIRCNYTTSEYVYDNKDTGIPGTNRDSKPYLFGGWLTLQDMVHRFMADRLFPTAPDAYVTPRFIPMPIAEFSRNEFFDTTEGYLPILFAIAFLYPFAQFTTTIVKEKETRAREGMLIMGLSSSVFRLSWVLTAFMQFSLTAWTLSIYYELTYFKANTFSITLIVMWLFCLSLAAFAIFLSVFFSKSDHSSFPCLMILLGCFLFGVGVTLNIPFGPRIICAFVPGVCFFEALEQFMDLGDLGGMSWSQAGQDDDFPLSACMIMMIVDIFAYLLLAWYFDNVLPGEWGARRPWYFLCCPRMWSKYAEEKIDENAEDGLMRKDLVEPADYGDKQPTVAIKNVRKEFSTDSGTKVAVNNFNFNLYEGEILALLGHNGAGKTTLISLLTGMLPTTSGTATVYGNSVVTSLSEVRQGIGFCPQHNILWDELTVAEHLRFYGSLKGIPAKQLEEKVDSMIASVQLEEKKDAQSKTLSGGMKRRLSIAMALIGGSRLIIFDEPTAGLDVQSRRAVWDLLKASKVGRTVILTTHFMDEADLLGDRIAIMHHGRLNCAGTSLFLKTRLGVGYNVKIDFDTKKNRDRVTELIEDSLKDAEPPAQLATPTIEVGDDANTNVPGVKILSYAGSELSYRVPLWAASLFPQMFKALETDGKALGVRSFGVSVTTLEEIFLRISFQNSVHDHETPAENHPDIEAADPAQQDEEFNRKMFLATEDKLTDGALLRSQFMGFLKKRFHTTKRDKKAICIQILLPLALIIFALAVNVDVLETLDPITLSDSFDDPSQWVTNDAQLNASAAFTTLVLNAPSILDMDRQLLAQYYRDEEDRRYIGLYANGADGTFTDYFNYTRDHAVAYSATVGAAAQMSAANGGARVNVQAVNNPLPYSDYTESKAEGIESVFLSLWIILPFTLIPSNYVAFLVRERETKAKHLQLVSGARLSVFWAASFVWDFTVYFITAMLILIIFAIGGRDEYTSGDHFIATFLLFVLYGLCAVSFSYLASFYFQNHSKAQNMVMLVNFITGLALMITAIILQVIDSTETVGEVLRFVFRVFPAFCLGDGIFSLSAQQITSEVAAVEEDTWREIKWDLLFLAVSFPIYLFAALAHDYPELLYKFGCKKPREPPTTPDSEEHSGENEEDPDVTEERLAVEQNEGRPGDFVTVQRLSKTFHGHPPKRAVRGVSFGVKENEIFAFLGTNGAGKTTTLSIVSGEIQPDSGRCFVRGHDVQLETSLARREMGYCPQFDALFDLMTPREHLEFYAGLRGVPRQKRPDMISALLDTFELTEYHDKPCKTLSGGNKRKTSVAISLIGNPSCLFLDEPTAGMDPASRRGLWKALQRVGQARCVILTTHHLEEVEAVGHRMAVMVSGVIDCIGTLQHLKSKFGGAYEVELKTSPAKLSETKTFFSSAFPGVELVEIAGTRLTYKIPTNQHFHLSELFQKIVDNKDDLEISDYSLTQTSLDQVFMTICKRHVEHERIHDDVPP